MFDRKQFSICTFIVMVTAPATVASQTSALRPRLTDARLWSPPPPATAPRASEKQAPHQPSYSFVGTAGAAGLGALVGGVVGLYLGQRATDLDRRREDAYLIYGAILGSWIGGWSGATSVSGQSGPSALGSALGVATGGFALSRSRGSLNGVVAYAVTHGLITAIVNTAWR